ncbi:DUF3859 domain-containing protein [Pararhodobacter marinus]|uniref:DUF3859 domain-containing protein n=1 Tax=Pararhodobacter marinus TaxID=2184063 RepID=A0A2U2C410_9RHOB|nr:DUF3859 domain-containing protein [Pararhodobacter marinus]PWE26579.1 DUF3859 domain-containing protein [Pararhodobacter marinus]
MTRLAHILAGPVLVAGLCLSGASAAQPLGAVSPRVSELELGLFCAPPEGGRRPAPDTMSGWVHVPDEPVEMVARGTVAPAVLGMGFGVRFRLADDAVAETRYTVTHPPMLPTGITEQHWSGSIAPGLTDTVFFQFDIPEELQTGDWTFSVEVDGEVLFTTMFTVVPPADLPGAAHLCAAPSLLS